MSEIMHEEKAPHSAMIKAFFLGVLLLLVAATVLSWTGIYESSKDFEALPLVTAIVVFAYWSYFNMRFRITTEGVEAVMVPFTHRVSYGEITEVRVIDKIPWYVGWGLRIWMRRLAYVSMHKSAVAIDKKKGIFKTLVLTTENPERFAEMINQRMEQLSLS
ncbi:MAG: hypothetical protein V3V92_06795 [Candidatus Hydrothermarchaeales archaeon]